MTYDLVAWSESGNEWVPRGYSLGWRDIQKIYARKKELQPSIRHRVVLVETRVKMVDVTDRIEKETE